VEAGARAAGQAGAPDVAGLHVLFLCHSAKPSGAELALLTLTRHMAPGTTTVLFAEDGPLVARFTAEGVMAAVVDGIRRGGCARRRTSPVTALRGLIDVARYGRRVGSWAADREVDVVVARSVKALLYGAVAARALHVPLVWSVHDRIAADYLGRLSALAVRSLGRVLAQGYLVNSRTTSATIWPGHKPVLVAPPALDRSRFIVEPVRPEVAAPVRRVVMVGRISPWKGQHVFLEAFEQVFADTDVEAYVVGGALFGEREYEAELHRTASAGRCAGRVHFTGHLDDVRHHLLSADVLVHASVVPEPFGLVVSEGMAAGCAVIATTPGGPA
jgi:glycosyltransferase involved in cell wall biosynthesis